MNVILVHGIFENGGLFTTLAEQLRSRNHTCFIPALKPNDARYGIADLSHRLVEYIDSTLRRNDRFAIVGFSMGCMVSRYYLQTLGGLSRCNGFFAISAPFLGTKLAYLHYGQGGRDLRPNSEFILNLRAGEQVLLGLPIYSYRTPYDLMIVPSSSSQWLLAENHTVKAAFHDLMPRNKFIISHICEKLEEMELN